jgi:hypothetical protein
VLTDEVLKVLVEPFHHLPLAACHRRKNEADVLHLDPQFVALPYQRQRLRALQHHLGGDAPSVQTNTADLVLLHDGCPQAQLRRSDGCRVAAGAPTKDD